MLGNNSSKNQQKLKFLYQDGHHPPKMGTLSTANQEDINNIPIPQLLSTQ